VSIAAPLSKWPTLLLLALAELLAMSLWFSASAVVPSLVDLWHLDGGDAAWLTMAVQVGFVTGGLLSAAVNLADLFPPRVVFAVGATLGAAANAAIPLLGVGFGVAVALRFATGFALAAVYPVGMKIMATWTREDRGLGLGLLVGALTIGSALPHLVRGFGGIGNWQFLMYVVSILAVGGGIMALVFGHVGPYSLPSPRLEWRRIGDALRDRPLRLANFGYLGHMWEVYAMWTWVPFFLAEAYRASAAGANTGAAATAAFAGFGAIAIGGIGCVVAGISSDRWGRTWTTIASLVVSGACAATIGIWFSHPIVVTIVALIWGFAVVADSAQFSTAVSELAEPRFVGTQLTAQTAAGFLLTMVSIRLVPAVAELISWRWAFVVLVPGPMFGIWAMASLRRSPARERLAGGRG